MAVAKEQEQSNQGDSLDSVTHQTQDQSLAIIAKPKVVSLALNVQNLDHFSRYFIDCINTKTTCIILYDKCNRAIGILVTLKLKHVLSVLEVSYSNS